MLVNGCLVDCRHKLSNTSQNIVSMHTFIHNPKEVHSYMESWEQYFGSCPII